MNPNHDLLQECLARLEAGESEEKCLADLSENEVLLLRKAIALRSIAVTAPSPEIYQARRSEFLRFAKEERSLGMKPSSERSGSRWVLPVVVAGGIFALFACLVIASVLAGLSFITGSPEVVREALPRQTEASAPDSTITLLPAEVPTVLAQEPTTATLVEARGLVEIKDKDGEWQPYKDNAVLKAGQHIRTGKFSSITLRFYDGSEAHLGPSSELSVDKLDAQKDGPRVISLTQLLGESEHQVVTSSNPDSRYEVDTPAGYGTAKGTRFRVSVSVTLFVRFDVDEGEVEVTHLGSTVIVVAGQSTTCGESLAPTGPFFHMRGEGRVDLVGASWRIAGSIFQTSANTVTIGNPQVGDWVGFEALVLMDGTRVIYRIFLLERAQKNQFELRGKVEAISTSEWVISGKAIQVNESTLIDPGIQVGNEVKVLGYLIPDGTLTATRIQLTVDVTALKFDFTGVVQSITETTWNISNATVTVNPATQIEAGITTGSIVRVLGQISDGVWLAQAIRLTEEEFSSFSFAGQVESISPWLVSGISFVTDADTQTDPLIAPGDQVRVEGRILANGIWLARRIRLLKDVDLNVFNFWGVVRSTNPWIVGGIPLTVNENTSIVGKTAVSRLVHVIGVILPDGTWLAQEIAGLDLRQGCLSLTSAVRQVTSNKIVLFNMQEIRLSGGAIIQGEVKIAAIVLVSGCVGEDGTIVISHVTVIYQLSELPFVIIPGSGSGDGHDDDDDDD